MDEPLICLNNKTDFEKNLFLKQQVKELQFKIGVITSERDEWRDKYNGLNMEKKSVTGFKTKTRTPLENIDYKSLSPKQKKKVRYSMKDQVVDALQEQIHTLQEVIISRNERISTLEEELEYYKTR